MEKIHADNYNAYADLVKLDLSDDDKLSDLKFNHTRTISFSRFRLSDLTDELSRVCIYKCRCTHLQPITIISGLSLFITMVTWPMEGLQIMQNLHICT